MYYEVSFQLRSVRVTGLRSWRAHLTSEGGRSCSTDAKGKGESESNCLEVHCIFL